MLGYFERKSSEVERLAAELIELSTRQCFRHWLALGSAYRGWARSSSGNPAEGISWIENGIRDYRAIGSTLFSLCLVLKADTLHLADRTSEALEVIDEAEAMAERFEQRYYCAELHRLRGVFLAATGAEETQIEASFGEAIRIARDQKSVSLEKRAEASYAEYRCQKASGPGGRGFRLPLC
jgi:adenylate cyclase